jgi:L-alanine-DL-glutamate epimerase-like enolase superfamily enzyme
VIRNVEPQPLDSDDTADGRSPAAGTPLIIRDVRIHRLRVVEDVGELDLAWSPGSRLMFQRGGGAFIEIETEDGLTGIGPETDDRFLPVLKQCLIGKDAFDVERLSAELRYYLPAGNYYQQTGCVDIALWDLIGKACGQPLHRLWGSSTRTLTPYASMVRLSTPEERAEMAVRLQEQNWRAIKLRLHHDEMAEDIRTVQLVREAVGDDMAILADANQAQSKGEWQPGVIWDYRRAAETAQAMQELGCEWLEEPRPRYAFDELARLSASVEIPIAGGESNANLHEFVQMCEQNTYGILQPECLVMNGITALRKVGVLAELHGKKIVPHNGYGKLAMIAHMHLVASWRHAPYLEVVHDPPVGDYRHFLSIFTEPPLVGDDGLITLPDAPGLGVTIDRDLIVK